MNETYIVETNKIQNDYSMRQAKESDTENVMKLLIETAKWFQANGSTQWNELLDGVDSHQTGDAIKQGKVFICKKNAEIDGMVMLLQSPSEWDKALWALDENDPNDAVYLHRLAISRKFANQQVGKAILHWCKTLIHFKNKEKLRLDCIADHPFLNQYYVESGFDYKGERDGFSLYEYLYSKTSRQ